MQMDNIRDLAYELYKADWIREHITPAFHFKVLCDYYIESRNAKAEFPEEDPMSFEDYIEEFGFYGELYVCYEEFLHAEYLDKEYITYLFRGDDQETLIKEYTADAADIIRGE